MRERFDFRAVQMAARNMGLSRAKYPAAFGWLCWRYGYHTDGRPHGRPESLRADRRAKVYGATSSRSRTPLSVAEAARRLRAVDAEIAPRIRSQAELQAALDASCTWAWVTP